MASPIEDIIEELEEYIDSCKPSAFSSSKIIVNRDEIEVIISELKNKVPDEVKKYQKIINNQEAIIADAKRQATEIISAAKIHTNELVSEHQIMQQAYAQANEVVMIATKNAQNTLDSATSDANEIRQSAIAYTDDLLKSVQDVIASSINTTRIKQDTFINTMQGYLDVVTENRIQLSPNPIAEEIMTASKDKVPSVEMEATAPQPEAPAPAPAPEPAPEIEIANTGVIDIPDQFFKKD